MKKIVMEEACAVKGFEKFTPQVAKLPEVMANEQKLLDFTNMRIAAMDEGEVDIMVVSITSPGLQGFADASVQVETAKKWNDHMANSIAGHTNRLRAFACLPMRYPDEAIKELQRAVKDLGFVGALVNGYDNAGGNPPIYYDQPEYMDFWKAVEDLDVPFYLHPRPAPEERNSAYKPYPELKGAAWGFHVETAEHVLRMIVSGLFDKFPKLKIIIGHMGEILPYWCWRTDHRIQREGWDVITAKEGRPRKLTVTEYVQRNTYVTNSGIFYTPALDHVKAVMPADHVMYSVDYPYEDLKEGNEWFKTLESNKNYDKNWLQGFAYDNAKKLLKI